MKYNSPQVKPDRVTSDNGRLSSSYNSSESSYVQEGQTEDIQTNCPLGETAPDFSNHTSSYNQDGENKPKADSLIDSSQSYLGKGKITTAYKGEKSDDWFTPKWLYDSLKKEFEINYDPCPYKHGEKMGLFNDWGGRVFVNPPYSNIDNWLNKAMLELKKGNSEIVIFLLFARTGTKWFHKYIWDSKNHKLKPSVKEIRFLRGRLKFGDSKGSAPDDNMIVIFQSKESSK